MLTITVHKVHRKSEQEYPVPFGCSALPQLRGHLNVCVGSDDPWLMTILSQERDIDAKGGYVRTRNLSTSLRHVADSV